MEMIDRYRVDRRLGAGSFATVWLGHDPELDVAVAVKVLADNWVDNADVRDRFVSEARIMRRLSDPRIVRVYDIGTLPDGRPFFVMDYANSGSLNDLRKAGVEPVPALRLCAQACRAIQVLHSHDVIHRDISPGNVLLDRQPSGRLSVLIADLGVAKSATGVVDMTMTAGTPAYMAHEQALGRGGFDHRVDVYSLTALTFAMLTGRPPYGARTLADVIARPYDATPEPIAARIGAPPTLDQVLVSGLANDPGRRPPTAAILADALERIADEMERGGAQHGFAVGPSSADTPRSMPPQPSPYQPQPPRPWSQPTPQSMPPAYAPAAQPPAPQGRPASFWILLGLGALVVFALTLLITVLALN